MLEKYNRQIYLTLRLATFMLLSYFVLRNVPFNNYSNADIFRLLLLISTIFIVVDNYYPNVYYE